MANIHRIGDYQDNEAGAGQGQRQQRMAGMFGGGGGQDAGPSEEDTRNNPLLRAFTARGQGGDPRKESFWSMLKIYFCPAFTWRSFIFIAFAINVIMFLVSIAMTNGFDEKTFLGIQVDTLCKLGAKDAKFLHQGQIWRFISPVVLHAGFMHLIQNNIFLLIIGSILEIIVGPIRFFIIYIVAGIGGVLMSALIDDKISVGASTALFGITAGLVAFLIVNWIAMEPLKEIRCCMAWFLGILIVINVIFGLTNSDNIDNFGHLGGFVTGLPLAMAIMPVVQSSMRRHEMVGWTYEKYCKAIGFVALSLWLGIGIIMFYAERNPGKAWP